MADRKALLFVAAALVSFALGLADAVSAQGQARSVLAASGLTGPLYATAPMGDPRIFVVERAGRIRVIKDGGLVTTPFLDIRSRVTTVVEGGLLGLAFPPDYADSGLFYVYYTASEIPDPTRFDDSVVSRFRVTSNPDVANPNSEQIVLLIDQPAGRENHKGGTIHFGADGFLWFATGDGGGANDPDELAQNLSSLLGKLLRIDPGPVFAPGSIPVAGQIYRIPADNPFVGVTGRDEIWARGFRNPYRWSFDRQTGDIWIGDVGQFAREEVDFEPVENPGGRNYGWDVMEGTFCNTVDPAPSPPCNHASLTLPIYDYSSASPANECSVIGGFVFRGNASPLAGLYFFGDFCTGRVWSLNPANRSVVERTAQLGDAANEGFALVGFGEDGFGRLLLVQSTGKVWWILSASSGGCGIGPELALVVGGLLVVTRRRALPTSASG